LRSVREPRLRKVQARKDAVAIESDGVENARIELEDQIQNRTQESDSRIRSKNQIRSGNRAALWKRRFLFLAQTTASAAFALPCVAIAACAFTPMCRLAQMSKEFAEHFEWFVPAFAAAVRVAWR
jgi:hypothetical protein